MGYWDKKNEEVAEEKEPLSMTIDEYEAMAERKLIEDGVYLSRKMKEHKERFDKVTSDGFWFCVYFNNDEQKEEFLDSIGFEKNCRYVPGPEFAKKIGKQLKTANFDFGPEKKPVKEFKERARPIFKGDNE